MPAERRVDVTASRRVRRACNAKANEEDAASHAKRQESRKKGFGFGRRERGLAKSDCKGANRAEGRSRWRRCQRETRLSGAAGDMRLGRQGNVGRGWRRDESRRDRGKERIEARVVDEGEEVVVLVCGGRDAAERERETRTGHLKSPRIISPSSAAPYVRSTPILDHPRRRPSAV